MSDALVSVMVLLAFGSGCITGMYGALAFRDRRDRKLLEHLRLQAGNIRDATIRLRSKRSMI